VNAKDDVLSFKASAVRHLQCSVTDRYVCVLRMSACALGCVSARVQRNVRVSAAAYAYS
jgi:hypothetical protein